MSELWRVMIESRRESGGESISGDCGTVKDFGDDMVEPGGVMRVLPRRILQVGQSLTKREMSSFGTLKLHR